MHVLCSFTINIQQRIYQMITACQIGSMLAFIHIIKLNQEQIISLPLESNSENIGKVLHNRCFGSVFKFHLFGYIENTSSTGSRNMPNAFSHTIQTSSAGIFSKFILTSAFLTTQ